MVKTLITMYQSGTRAEIVCHVDSLLMNDTVECYINLHYPVNLLYKVYDVQ